MRLPRFSIARLMGLVLIVGMIFWASRRWDVEHLAVFVAATITVLSLLWTSLRAGLGPVSRRRFWFAFSVFGWAHLLVLQSNFEEILPTYAIESEIIDGIVERADISGPAEEQLRYDLDNPAEATMILSSLPVGLIGGGWIAWLGRARAKDEARTGTDAAS